MKCPHCGAEINPQSRYCESCGSQISYQMQREQEYLNKIGCPRCHSSNIQFKRENQGETLTMYKGFHNKRVIHRTVGFCRDCGYTWFADDTEKPVNNNSYLWIISLILCPPAVIMVLIWRKKNTWNTPIKIAATVAFWLLAFIAYRNVYPKNNTINIQRTPNIVVTATPVSNKNNSIKETAEFYELATVISIRLNTNPEVETPELLIRPN